MLFHLYAISEKEHVNKWKTGPGAFRDWEKKVDYNGSTQVNFCSFRPVPCDTVVLDKGLYAFVKALKTTLQGFPFSEKKIKNQTDCLKTSTWNSDCYK